MIMFASLLIRTKKMKYEKISTIFERWKYETLGSIKSQK